MYKMKNKPFATALVVVRRTALLLIMLWSAAANSLLFTLHSSHVRAQSALEMIKLNRNFAASNYSVYPDSAFTPLTPAPAGKKPFYISHYGRHGSRYLNQRKVYDTPYNMLKKADSLQLLTPTGRMVLNELHDIIADSEGRWGDLTGRGKQQLRNIARRMMENFPEVFSGDTYIDARSTTVARCMISMGAATQYMAYANPELQISIRASKRDMWYMNHQDALLRKNGMSPLAKQTYDTFWAKHDKNPRLMKLLFTNPDSALTFVNERWFNYYLIKTGLILKNTHMAHKTSIINLFTDEDVYDLWQIENAYWYILHGASLLNGAKQPYSQRYLLRQLIADADSCIRQERPDVQLRFGHETVLLPLVCLIGVNGFDLQTESLEELEEKGWMASLVFPMASNLQFVFYRSDLNDEDIVFKVLLNEREATLPIPTDMAPYYHWHDFRTFYLNKLDSYQP